MNKHLSKAQWFAMAEADINRANGALERAVESMVKAGIRRSELQKLSEPALEAIDDLFNRLAAEKTREFFLGRLEENEGES